MIPVSVGYHRAIVDRRPRPLVHIPLGPMTLSGNYHRTIMGSCQPSFEQIVEDRRGTDYLTIYLYYYNSFMGAGSLGGRSGATARAELR